MQRFSRKLAALLIAGFCSVVQAYDGPVKKEAFELAEYTTVGGKTIRNVRVGYESYGTLNARGDNAIFIAHFYSSNSHAAGKYSSADVVPGYWNAIIGPGKPIDTDKYFVISADTLVNINAKDPNTITTGPATLNPATGKPYGMSFPVVTARDFVRVHKALLDKLGVRKLHAVMGASGGSMQAFEWAALYPEMVERIVPVISPGLSISPYALALMESWTMPVRLDPNWNDGDYYGRAEPAAGLTQALKLVTFDARHFGWAEKSFGYKWADPARDPLAALDNRFQIETVLEQVGATRAKTVDANSMLYTSKALQLYNLENEAGRIKAKVLLIPARSDLIFPPELSQRTAEKLRANGNPAEVFELEGDGGHLDGIFQIAQAGERIRAFLGK